MLRESAFELEMITFGRVTFSAVNNGRVAVFILRPGQLHNFVLGRRSGIRYCSNFEILKLFVRTPLTVTPLTYPMLKIVG